MLAWVLQASRRRILTSTGSIVYWMPLDAASPRSSRMYTSIIIYIYIYMMIILINSLLHSTILHQTLRCFTGLFMYVLITCLSHLACPWIWCLNTVDIHDCIVINPWYIYIYIYMRSNRAINYRHNKGFDHLSIGLSVGIQKMVRSDLASSGVMFSLDPDSGSPISPNNPSSPSKSVSRKVLFSIRLDSLLGLLGLLFVT